MTAVAVRENEKTYAKLQTDYSKFNMRCKGEYNCLNIVSAIPAKNL